MGLFADYEQEFVDTLSSLQNRLGSFPSISTDQKFNEIKKADNEIRDAEQTLQSMNLEARTVPGPQGAKLQAKIKEYEAEIAKIKKDLRRSEVAANESAARESLLGGAIIKDDIAISLDQRERLLNNNERLNRSTVHLKNARRQAEETIEVGAGILDNLSTQRETMERGLGRLSGINDKLSQSSKLLSAMARRVATNKLIMGVIVLVLLGAIILIIWLKWFRK